MLIIILVVALIVSITIGYIYYNPERQDTSSVPDNPIITGTAILNISVESNIGAGFHVIVSIDDVEIVNRELGPTNETTNLGSYDISVGSENFLVIIANFYNESGELLYTDWDSFWAIGGGYYDLLLHPIPINIGSDTNFGNGHNVTSSCLGNFGRKD